jgi:hypothetical protein
MLQFFPGDEVPGGASLAKWPWLFSIAGLITGADLLGIVPPALLRYAGLIFEVTFTTTFLGYSSYRFIHADPVTRRQIKWVLFGFYLAAVPTLGVEALVFVKAPIWPLGELVPIFYVFVPLCIFIAIVRFNLFDIDRLISATAAYTIVSALVIAGAITVLPDIAQAANKMVGLDHALGQFMLSLLLAAVIVPGSRYLRPRIERLFFSERYALEHGLEHLLREIYTCPGPRAVLALVGERLDSYLRPESCVVYGRSGESYVPLFFRGRAVAPTIDAKAALVTALQSETRSIEVERWLRRRALSPSSSDRAVLDSLGAAVLAPMHRGHTVEVFACLAQKRSGDVYTATDLTLITAVAERVSAELRRFDEAEIARQVRAMSDSLRRYVPEQIAAQVVSGDNLEARETEVSILFVDIRGYTTYAEDKSAAEVFSTVNRYTDTVSRIIRAHGGTVVEFDGDGMMAVFGAPRLQGLSRDLNAAIVIDSTSSSRTGDAAAD